MLSFDESPNADSSRLSSLFSFNDSVPDCQMGTTKLLNSKRPPEISFHQDFSRKPKSPFTRRPEIMQETRPELVKRTIKPSKRRALHERPDLDEYARSVEINAKIAEQEEVYARVQHQCDVRESLLTSFHDKQQQRMDLEATIGLDVQRQRLAAQALRKVKPPAVYQEEEDEEDPMAELDRFEENLSCVQKSRELAGVL
ncbi:hypothetical protein GEMRC1_000475 [Eukaryota sp. GEM-RC1]